MIKVMSLVTRAVEHILDGETFENLFLFDDTKPGPRPIVLVCHGWEGRSEEQNEFARLLVDWGYAALAVDVYGKGKTGRTREECQALMTPLVADRSELAKRLLKAVEVAQSQPEGDPSKLGAIGFCFGGLCVLDLARVGAHVKCVASFHGVLMPAGFPIAQPFKPKVALFHGWDDPFALPAHVLALAKELTDVHADWQLHAYGGVRHAFMNKAANSPRMGLVYHPKTARRAWNLLGLFLAETLA